MDANNCVTRLLGVVAVLGMTGMAGATAAPVSTATSPLPQTARPLQSRVKQTSYKLNRSLIDASPYGGSLTALTSGDNTIDTTTVACPGANGCTVDFQIMAQAGANTSTGNQWAICAVVDGTFANPGCPYQGTLTTDNTYITGFSGQSLSVPTGKHTLSTIVYTANGAATLGEWHVVYNIYNAE